MNAGAALVERRQLPLSPSMSTLPTTNPLVGSGSANQRTYPSRCLKRTISAISCSSDNDGDSECLTISNLLAELHVKYPRLNFPQYETLLAEKSILYAESVLEFDKYFYLDLGMAEGSIGSFMRGVSMALKREKGKKRAKLDDKENYNRQESVEI